jgi:hypothetical protein
MYRDNEIGNLEAVEDVPPPIIILEGEMYRLSNTPFF